jgi:membrane protease subunit (stomatin/prohibitin family)
MMRGGRRGPGLVGTMARTAVVAGTATVVAGKVAGHQQQKAVAAQQQQQQAAAQPQAEEPQQAVDAAPVEEDPLLTIQKLAALRDQGILTEEEFSAKKAQILGI